MKKSMGGCDVVFIDHMHLMKEKAPNIREMFIKLSGGIKEIAKEEGVAIVALAQCNREPDTRPDKRPIIRDLKESSSIEADADAILFAYRDSFYKSEEDLGEANPNQCELIVRKNRHGDRDNLSLYFIGCPKSKILRTLRS
jgi:replicative DNA helicase